MGIQDHPDTTTIVRQTSAYENTPSTDVHGPKFCDPACLSSVLPVLAQQDPLMSGPGPFTSDRWIYNFKTSTHTQYSYFSEDN